MSRMRLTIYVILMLAGLCAVGYWQNHSSKSSSAASASSEIVSLMPYSQEWKLNASQKAMVVLVYTPNEVSEKQMAVFRAVAKRHGSEIRFAFLNLTRTHPGYSNSVYAAFYGITKSPTFIIRRKGESDYHKHSGSMTAEELETFIQFGLNNAAPAR